MAKLWRTLLIEDEEPARQRLRRLLAEFDTIEVIGEAVNGAEGLTLVNSLSPDLIFLDIEMPVLNGFDLLKQLARSPKVIFTTAYDQYAVKAFEEESVDYLLKPVSVERLEKAVKKLQQLEPQAEHSLPLELLIKQLAPKKELKTLTVKIGDRIILVKIADIAFIDAEEKYVFLHTVDGNRYLTDVTLAALELKLPDQFVRINRSTILHAEQIAEIRRNFNGAFSFVMLDVARTKLVSSRSYGAGLRERFDL